MTKGKLEVELTAIDKASDVVEDVADKVDKLDSTDTDVTIAADDRASDELADIRQKLNRLDGDEARALLTVEAKAARADLRQFTKQLLDLDDEEAEVEVKADIDQAKRRLAAINDELSEVDKRTVDATVDVDDQASGDIAGISDMLDGLPGLAGEAGGALTAAGGPVAGVAALGAGMFAFASHQSDAALDAATLADLTGLTVDNASRLITVSETAGIEMNDLADMALQARDALADAPEYAEQLGINLADGKTPGERLVELLSKMNDSTLGANEKAEIFSKLLGEEGVRQGQKLATTIGDVERAMEDVPDGAVFTDEDVEQAQEFKRNMAELTNIMKTLANSVGDDVIPVFSDLGNIVGTLSGDMEKFGVDSESSLGKFLSGVGKAKDEAGKFLNPVVGLIDAVGDLSDGLDDLTGKNEDFAGVVEAVGLATAGTADSTNSYAKEQWLAARASDNAGDSADDLADDLDEAADSTDDFTDSVEDSRQTLVDFRKEQLAQVDPTFAAMRAVEEHEQALADLNAEGGDTPENLRKVVTASAEMEAAMLTAASQANLTGDQIYDMGVAAGLTEEQAYDLAVQVGLTTEKAEDFEGDYSARLFVDSSGALQQIADVNSEITLLDGRTATVKVNVIQNGERAVPGSVSHVGSRFHAGESKMVVPGQVFTPDVPGRMSSVEESARMTSGGGDGTSIHVDFSGATIGAGVDVDVLTGAIENALREQL